MSETKYRDRIDLIALREYGNYSSESMRALLYSNPDLARINKIILPVGVTYTAPVVE